MIRKKAPELLLIGLLITYTTPAYADVHVNGYYRSDGTYVKPHYRSDPDGNFNNNWSTKGNINPYTGEEGTKTHPDSDTGSERIQTYPNYSVENGYNPQISTPIEPESFEETQRRITEEAAKRFKEIQEKSAEDLIKQQNEIMEKYEGNEYNQQVSAPNSSTAEQLEEIRRKATEDFIKQQNEIMKKYEGNSQKQQEEIDNLLKELQELGNYTPPVISDTTKSTNTQGSTNNQNTEYYEFTDSASEDISNDNQVSVSDKPSFWDKFITFIKGLFS